MYKLSKILFAISIIISTNNCGERWCCAVREPQQVNGSITPDGKGNSITKVEYDDGSKMVEVFDKNAKVIASEEDNPNGNISLSFSDVKDYSVVNFNIDRKNNEILTELYKPVGIDNRDLLQKSERIKISGNKATIFEIDRAYKLTGNKENISLEADNTITITDEPLTGPVKERKINADDPEYAKFSVLNDKCMISSDEILKMPGNENLKNMSSTEPKFPCNFHKIADNYLKSL